MFKNAMIYNVTPGSTIDAIKLSALGARECGALDMRTAGFSPTRNDGINFIHTIPGAQIIRFQTHDKLLPSSVISDEVKKQAAKIEQSQGCKLGHKQRIEIKDLVIAEMLPKAFSVRRDTLAMLTGNRLIIDTSSAARAELLIEYLIKSGAIENDTITRPKAALNGVSYAMHKWFETGAPEVFTIDQDCTLKSLHDEATVVFKNESLDGGEIADHMARGKVPTKLAMTWKDRISFILTDKFEIKRLRFMDVVIEEAQEPAETEAEQFDADMTIMAGELDDLLIDLELAIS